MTTFGFTIVGSTEEAYHLTTSHSEGTDVSFSISNYVTHLKILRGQRIAYNGMSFQLDAPRKSRTYEPEIVIAQILDWSTSMFIYFW